MEQQKRAPTCEARHPFHPAIRCGKTRGHSDKGHRFMSWDAKRVVQWEDG